MDCIAMVAKSQIRLSHFHFHLIWLEMEIANELRCGYFIFSKLILPGNHRSSPGGRSILNENFRKGIFFSDSTSNKCLLQNIWIIIIIHCNITAQR